ncbi:hypothetical protein LTR91_018555 [Friedmanniomyces endolithicus]|uniref:Cohesin loading factor n=2 Tax=Friedmanniomyces endolithicus TaxID=329885 RepID=A0AAN6K260_9PEZI|nr:hypothetical protein LTR57_020572 [Friedmanniomyces endolithicus]KAK0964277.1 hypothetical protein LTR91_018555 [Friedmanniomyces endolithicus]KAK0976929.1 hypothetical protein LTR54_016362 [Friedmanniomyces endolithicus]
MSPDQGMSGGRNPSHQAHHHYHQPLPDHSIGKNGIQYATHFANVPPQHQNGRSVQPAPRPFPTSSDVYRPLSQPHLYQQPSPAQLQRQPPYQAPVVHQPYPYQQSQPHQYQHPQPFQQTWLQAHYQPSPVVQPIYHQSPDDRPAYSQSQHLQSHHRGVTDQKIQSSAVPQTPRQSPPHRPQERKRQKSRPVFPSPAASSTPQRWTVAQVQIPVARVDVASTSSGMPRAAKRRHSNGGTAVAVCDELVAQKPPKAQLLKPEPAPELKTEPAPKVEHESELASVPIVPRFPPTTDYQAVLLSLADEYVMAAHQMSPALAASDFDSGYVERYHQLMSTALGCLESVLKNFRQLDARKEARIRLRLASLLHEETENSEQAGELLSKGIALCERNRLTDLQYAMHHLLVRVSAKGSHKAAIKAVEKLIAEAEALKLGHWVYSFRFLRVSLGLQVLGPTETAAVLKHLSALKAAAESQRHITVQIVAATLDAAVHLKSGAPDAIELAQRAIAAARMHQLSPEMQCAPQLRALLDCLDLACSLMQHNSTHIIEKMRQMQTSIDATKYDNAWTQNSSTFLVPIGSLIGGDVHADTAGIMAETAKGELGLRFDWIHKGQLYALGYLLSGVASNYKHGGESQTDEMLEGALRLARLDAGDFPYALPATIQHADWQRSASVVARLQQASVQCARSEWASASKIVLEVEETAGEYEPKLDTVTQALLVYIGAVIKHGDGDLKGAEAAYASAPLAWDSNSKEISALRDMQAVACLNRIHILQHVGRRDEAERMLTLIEPFAIASANLSITAGYYIVAMSAQGPQSPILKLKKELHPGIKAAKAAANTQQLCMIMSIMTNMFFTNIVGDQAIKAARASRTLARQCGSKLWQAVADTRIEGEKMMRSLPESLTKRFQIVKSC